MRKLAITALILVVILVAAVLIVPHLTDINQYRAQIQEQLQKRLGRPVTLGEMSLSLFPPSFQVQNTVIAEDPRFQSSQPFARVEKLAVSVKLRPLLHKQVEITSLELNRPYIELIRNAQGEWNFATLGPAAKPAASQPESKGAGQLTLTALAVNDGQVAITDQQKHQSRAVYDNIDLNVSDFAPDQPFSLKVTAHLPSEGKTARNSKQAINLQGKAGPIKKADMMNTPFDGQLKLDQVSLSAAQKFLNSQGLQGIDALITGDATVKTTSGKLASAGKIKFDNMHIHKVDIGYPITLDYDLTDDLTADVIQINKSNLKLGNTPVTAAGTLNTKPNPAQLDMKVTAANASIQEAARLASAFGVAFGKGMDVRGVVNANIRASGAANKPALNGQLSAQNINISGGEIPQPVSISNIELALTPDTIRSNDFKASTGSTSAGVNFALAQYTTANSTINAALRISNAKIGELLNIAKAAGISAADNITGDGILSLDVHAQGPTKNMSAMVFNGTGKIQNASLKLPSLAQPVQIRNSDIAFNQNSANVQNIAASIGQANATGQITVKDFAAPQVNAAVKIGNARIGELLSIAKAAGVSAADNIEGDGILNLDVHAQGPTKNMSAMVFNGTGKIQGASLKLPSLTKPIQIKNADIALNQNSANLQNLAVSVGQTNTSGQLTIKNFAAPQVQFALNADKVDVVELQSLTAKPVAPAKRADSRGFWQITEQADAQTPANANAEPSIITRMTGNGTVAIGTVTDNELILNNVHSNVALDRGVIKLNPLTADVYNGKENGSVTIDLRPAQPVYNVNLKTEKVDANKLISSVSDLKQTLYGLLSSNVNASFSSSSADAIARSLNGTMAIDLSNGKLMNVDLLHELATVGKFLGSAVPSAPKGFTNLTSLTGNFDVKNGLAQTNNLKAAIDGGTLAATGLVNLADHSLNMKMTAVLNKELSQQVGGNQVGGFMNTALANNQGELVLPVLVTGTFQHPQVVPDVQQIAQMKLQNMLPTSKNPGQLTTGILGKVMGGQGAPAPQAGGNGTRGNGTQGNGTQGGTQGAINGVLGALGVGQQKQQPAQQAPSSPSAAPPSSSTTAEPASGAAAPSTAPGSTTAAPASTTAAPDSTPAAAPAASPAASPQSAQDTINGILGQVLKGKKTPTPTPTPQ